MYTGVAKRFDYIYTCRICVHVDNYNELISCFQAGYH